MGGVAILFLTDFSLKYKLLLTLTLFSAKSQWTIHKITTWKHSDINLERYNRKSKQKQPAAEIDQKMQMSHRFRLIMSSTLNIH